VACYKGHCAGFQNDLVDFQCIIDVYTETDPGDPSSSASGGNPSPNPVCAQVSAPQEQIDRALDRSYCHFLQSQLPGDNEFRPWVQCTANQQGSTVHMDALSVFCEHGDGTITPAGGSVMGQSPVTWSGLYKRSPWFANSDGSVNFDKQGEATFLGSNTLAVPTNPYVVHFGIGASSVGCRDGIVTAQFSTTGDAQCQIGLDYHQGNTWTHEASTSDWKSCTSGSATLQTPWIDHQSCDGPIGVCVPSTEICNNVDDDCDGQVDEGGVCTPASNCPPTGFRITAAPSLLASCPALRIVTWDKNGNLVQSAPGQSLTINEQWNGYAWTTTTCNGVYNNNWPQQQTVQNGFSEVCVSGVDITNGTLVCWIPSQQIWRPAVPMWPGGAGTCQP
jgi:hypothetical protein